MLKINRIKKKHILSFKLIYFILARNRICPCNIPILPAPARVRLIFDIIPLLIKLFQAKRKKTSKIGVGVVPAGLGYGKQAPKGVRLVRLG